MAALPHPHPQRPNLRVLPDPRPEPVLASPEAEAALLGAVLLEPGVIDYLCDGLDESDFFVAANRHVFAAMRDLYERGWPADLVTVADALQRDGTYDDAGGHAYLAQLMTAAPTSVHVAYYREIVRDYAERRRLAEQGAAQVRRAYDRSRPLAPARPPAPAFEYVIPRRLKGAAP